MPVKHALHLSEKLQRKLEATQEELMKTQIRYQKEIEKLEKINRELKKQLLLRGNDVHAKKKIKVDPSLAFCCHVFIQRIFLPPRNLSLICIRRC